MMLFDTINDFFLKALYAAGNIGLAEVINEFGLFILLSREIIKRVFVESLCLEPGMLQELELKPK